MDEFSLQLLFKILSKIFGKFQVTLKSDKITVLLISTDIYICTVMKIYLLFTLSREINQTKVVEKIKTLSQVQFFPEKRAFYEITWENMVQSDKLQMTI
jgi:hypothetical protein